MSTEQYTIIDNNNDTSDFPLSTQSSPGHHHTHSNHTATMNNIINYNELIEFKLSSPYDYNCKSQFMNTSPSTSPVESHRELKQSHTSPLKTRRLKQHSNSMNSSVHTCRCTNTLHRPWCHLYIPA